MRAAELVRRVRGESGLSIRALAAAAGVAASTVHRIERGTLDPTVDMLDRLVAAGGSTALVDIEPDHRHGMVGLALCVRDDLRAAVAMPSGPVRRAAELGSRIGRVSADERQRMLSTRPPPTGDQRWDAFIAALAEWLALRTDTPAPTWVHEPGRALDHGWWVTDLPSMQAWEYAGAPLSFKVRGVYIHRDSLVNV